MKKNYISPETEEVSFALTDFLKDQIPSRGKAPDPFAEEEEEEMMPNDDHALSKIFHSL